MRRDLRTVLAVVVLLIVALPAGYAARANPPLMTGDGGARAGFAVLAPQAEADIFDRAPSLDPNGSVSDTVGNESKVYRVTVDVPGELKMRVSGAGPELRARVRAINADKQADLRVRLRAGRRRRGGDDR